MNLLKAYPQSILPPKKHSCVSPRAAHRERKLRHHTCAAEHMFSHPLSIFYQIGKHISDNDMINVAERYQNKEYAGIRGIYNYIEAAAWAQKLACPNNREW